MLDWILVVALVLVAVATVMTARLLISAIALALASAILAVIMFRLDAPLAAVFELSVCAGLIPAILISAIGLTRRLGPEDLQERKRAQLKKYWFLPILIVMIAVVLSRLVVVLDLTFVIPAVAPVADPREVLWNLRHVDLLGQVVVLLGGAFAVVVLLKEFRDAR